MVSRAQAVAAATKVAGTRRFSLKHHPGVTSVRLPAASSGMPRPAIGVVIMKFPVSIAAVSLLSMSATAAPLASFTKDNVKAVLAGVGATGIEEQTSDGVQFINFDYKGLKYSTSIRFCDANTQKNCTALFIAVGFEADGADTLDTVNAFNGGFPIATVFKPDQQTIVFGRLVTALGGVDASNVAANIGLVVAGPQVYNEFRKSQVVASTGVGGTMLLSQGAAPAPALKPVRLTPAQVSVAFKLAPSKEALPK